MYIIESTRPNGKTLIDLDECIGIQEFKNDKSVTLYMRSGEKFHFTCEDAEALINDWVSRGEE